MSRAENKSIKRKQILDASLVIISKKGLRGLTFRAIAKEASVPLGLTTYYFKGMKELYLEAYRFFLSTVEHRLSETIVRAEKVIAKHPNFKDVGDEEKLAMIDELSRLLTSYSMRQVGKDRFYRLVEMAFQHEASIEPTLRLPVIERQNHYIESGATLFRFLGVKKPIESGHLLYALINQLERRSMISEIPLTEEEVYGAFHHLVQMSLDKSRLE